MLKVLHWKMKSEPETGTEKYPKYEVSLDGTKLSMLFRIPYRGDYHAGSFTVDLDAAREKVMDAFIKESDEFGALDIVEAYAYCSRTGYSNSFGKTHVARIVVDDKGDVFVVLTFACPDVVGCENVVMIADKTASGNLKEACAWFKDRFDKSQKKYGLIKELDPYKSIAYLEVQVDILTRGLLATLPEGSKYLNILKAADDQSILDIKPDDALLKEITDGKARVRELQRKYYEVIKDEG